MAERPFEASISNRAAAEYLLLSEDDQATVDRLVVRLEMDPWVDGITKFHYAAEVISLSACITEGIAIIYRMVDNRRILIWGIRADGDAWRRRHNVGPR